MNKKASGKNIVEKGEIALNDKQFLLFLQFFLPFWSTF